MSDSTHVIHSQAFELTAASETLTEAAQGLCERLLAREVPTVLERLFDEVAPAGNWIVLERLELNVGDFDLEDLERDLAERLEQALRTALPPAVAAAAVRPAAEGMAAGAGAAAEPAQGWPRVLHFLSFGVLPWWSPRPEPGQLEDELDALIARDAPILRTWLAQARGDPSIAWRAAAQFGEDKVLALTERLAPELARRVHAFSRAMRNQVDLGTADWPPEATALLWRAAWRAIAEPRREAVATEAFLEALSALPAATALPPGVLELAWRDSADVRTGETLPEAEGIAPKRRTAVPSTRPVQDSAADRPIGTARGLAARDRPATAIDASLVSEGAPPTTTGAAVKSSAAQEPNGPRPDPAEEGALPAAGQDPASTPHKGSPEAEPRRDDVALLRGLGHLTELAEAAQTETAEPPAGRAEQQPDSGPPRAARDWLDPGPEDAPPFDEARASEALSGVAVENAGLILLWPFFPTLFEALGYRDGEGWTSADKPPRAVHLLQFLASGETAAPEHALLLNKLLCGLPAREPVPAEVLLEPAEKEECEALLEAAIGHWPALRNTSPEGLRQGFLLRPGLLHAEEEVWVLRVETAAHDVLLDTLPWGYRRVELSWMPFALEVLW